MILTTTGLGEKMVKNQLKNTFHEPNKLTKNKYYNRSETARQNCVAFLESLAKLPSHYARADTSKLYLEHQFKSLEDLFAVYKQYCAEKKEIAVCKTLFVEEFKSKNLALYSPKKDQCDTCVSYEAGNLNVGTWQEHVDEKTKARGSKSSDKVLAILSFQSDDTSKEKVKVFTMDLQAVLLSPKLNTSALYYQTKLAVHNFTMFDLATADRLFCMA